MAKQNEGERIKKIADETQVVVEDALRSIASNIGDIFAQALTQGQNAAKTLGRDVTGTINSLAKSTDILVKNQEKANKGLLTYKDVTREIQNRNAKIQALKNQITIAERTGVGNAKELKKQLADIEKYNSEVADSMQQQLKYSKDISKTMGLTGAAISGIGKLAGKLGFDKMADVLEEARDRAASMAKTIVDSKGAAGGLGSKFKILGSTIGFLGKSLLKNLFDPLVLIKGAIGGIKFGFGLLRKAFNFFKQQADEGKEAYEALASAVSGEIQGLARGLGLAQKGARGLYQQVAGLGPTAAASASSIESIYSAMGSTEQLSAKTLDRFVKLNTYAGYSAESLANMQSYAKVLGKDAGDVVDEFNKQIAAQIKSENLAIGQKQAFEAVSKVSSSIRASLGGSEAAIVKAVLSSKKLGMELEDALDSAKGFLNLEENIAAEQELRLLTGQDIDLTKARELAATRDFAGLNKEIARITKQIGGDALNNQFVMEAITKTLGLSEDKVVSILNADKERVKTGKDLNTEAQNANMHAQGAQTYAEAQENRLRRIQALLAKNAVEYTKFSKYITDSVTEIRTAVMDAFGANFDAWWKDPEAKENLDSIKKSILAILQGASGSGGILDKTFKYIFDPRTGIVNRSLRDLKTVLGGGELTNPESFLGKAMNFFKELKNSETFQALKDGMEAGRKAVVSIVKGFDNLMKIPGMKTLLTTFVAGAATVKTFKFAMNATGLSSIFGKHDGSNPSKALYVTMAGGGMPGMAMDLASDMMGGPMHAGSPGGPPINPKTGKPFTKRSKTYQNWAKNQTKGKGFKPRPGGGGKGAMLLNLAMMAAPFALSAMSGGDEEISSDGGLDGDYLKEMQEQQLKDTQEELTRLKTEKEQYVEKTAKILSSKKDKITISVYDMTFTGANLAEAKGKAKAYVIQKELGTKEDEVKALQNSMKEFQNNQKETSSGPSFKEYTGGEQPGKMSASDLGSTALQGTMMGAMEQSGNIANLAKTGVQNVASKVKPTSSGGGNWFTRGFNKVKSLASSGVNAVKSGANAAMDFGKSAIKPISSKVGQAVDWGKGVADDAVSGAKNLAKTGVNALKASGWAMLEKIGGPQAVAKIKDLMKGNLLKNIFAKVAGFGTKALRWLFRTGPLSAAINSIFAVGEINDAVNAGMTGPDLQKLVGQKALGVLGGVAGGVGMEALTGLIMQGVGTLIPGAGNVAMGVLQGILSPTLYMAGEYLGRNLFQYGADALGGDIPVGKLIMSMGWPKEKPAAKADDMYSGYGKRILLHPEGAIALNNKDTVVAGTNLFRGDDVVSGPAGSMVSSAAVLAKLDQLIAVIERGGNVFLDGQKVGNALVQGNYRTQ